MKYDLVFEGGGAKGMAFVGACEEFFRRGHTFDRLLGTSAGAITATLLTAGYTPKEMLEALVEKEGGKSVFTGFIGPPLPFTDEEIATNATRRVLDGVDFTFVSEVVPTKLTTPRGKRSSEADRFVKHASWGLSVLTCPVSQKICTMYLTKKECIQ
jgi:predicted acylesterase/phospholipase RssA